MRISSVFLFALLIACSDSSGPGSGGVRNYVGEWCAKTGTVTNADGSTTTYTNTTTYQDVAGSDGIVRRQAVRGCTATIKLP